MLESHLRLYRSLNSHKVKYLVIGGVAVASYGVPRATLDLDLFIEASIPNVERCLKAFRKARFKTASMTSVGKVLAKDIILSKKATGRKIDLEDVKALAQLRIMSKI